MKTFFKLFAIILSIMGCLSFLPGQAYGAELSGIAWRQWGGLHYYSSGDPGGFNYPLAIAVDSHGNLYIADSGNHRIQKLTVSTGVWSQWGGFGTALGKFDTPRGVAVDGAGNLYVADSRNHRIQKLDVVTGEWSAWGKSGCNSGKGLGEFYLPYGVAVDSAGNVYVADTVNNRVQKRAADTGQWSAWGSGDLLSKELGDFSAPLSVAVDGQDNLYVADTSNNRIQKLDVVTGQWSAWGDYGKDPGKFFSPRSVAVDAAGNVYVADGMNHRVQKLDLAANTWSVWGKSGCAAGGMSGEFSDPHGIAVDQNGNLYVSDTGNSRIQKLSVTGEWTAWGKSLCVQGQLPGEFYQPGAVVLDEQGNVYVAERLNNRVQKLDRSTGVWTVWGTSDCSPGTGLGKFHYPMDIAVDSSGNIYVADAGNNRIQKLDIGTGQWSAWGTEGGALGKFRSPSGIAVDSAGNIYVSDCGNHRIQKLDIASDLWSGWGKGDCERGSGPGEFSSPYGISIDSHDNLYVADTSNQRVQRRSVDGQWTCWGSGGSGPGQFASPAGLAADGEGNLYVADTGNHRIQKWTKTTASWSALGVYGSALGAFVHPADIALDSSGNLYVADLVNNRIQYGLPKLSRPAPAAPRASSITINSVILTSDEGTLIAFHGQMKPSGSLWTELDYATTYTDACAYIPASDDYLESPPSDTCTFRTLDAYVLRYGTDGNGTVTGAATQIVADGGSGAAVTAVPNQGYHFLRWSDGYTGATRTDGNVSQDLSVTAYFEIDTYTVWFMIDEIGSIVATQQVRYNDFAVEPEEDPVYEDFPFLYWCDAGWSVFDFGTPVTSNLILYAYFDYYVVSFDANGGSPVSSQYVAPGNCALKPEDPALHGYTFAGWYTFHYDYDEDFNEIYVYDELFDFATPITGYLSLLARYKENPDYTAPADLTAVYGQTLGDIGLPDGFSWEDDLTTPVGDPGTNTFPATYTPEDTDTYATITGIEIPIAVGLASIGGIIVTPYGGTYDRSPHDAVTVTGTEEGDLISYSTDGSEYGDAAPQIIDAGAYAVYVRIERLHYDPWESGELSVVIGKAAQIIQGAGSYTKKTTEDKFNLDAESSAAGVSVTYELLSGDAVSVTEDGQVTIRKRGEAVVLASAPETSNYLSAEKQITIRITAPPLVSINAPVFQDYGIALSGQVARTDYDYTAELRYRAVGAADFILLDSGGFSFDKTFQQTLYGLAPNTEFMFELYAVDQNGDGAAALRYFRTPRGEAHTGGISGSVVDASGAGALITVTIEEGNTVIASLTGLANGSAFSFTNIPDGVYNVVADNGSYRVTRLAAVQNGQMTGDIVMSLGKTQSVIEIRSEDTPKAAVDGLAELFGQTDGEAYTPEDAALVAAGGTVELRLAVELKQASDIGDAEEKINEAAQPGTSVGLYLDLSIIKTATDAEGVMQGQTALSELPSLLKIVMPLAENLRGQSGITIFRVHGNSGAEIIPEGRENANADGEYCQIEGDYLTIYARKFSVYAVATVAPAPGGAGGGGRRAAAFFSITAEAGAGGVIAPASARVAKHGEQTFAIIADPAYEIADVLIDGISVGAVNTYTFNDVIRDHTIRAVFRKTAGAAAGLSGRFTDIGASWAKDDIAYGLEQGLFSGVSHSLFGPEAGMTRAMFAAVMARLDQADLADYTKSVFSDADIASWYGPPVAWATENGIIRGVGRGMFAPDRLITREEMAALLFRYAKFAGASTERRGDLGAFADGLTVSDWAAESVSWAIAEQFIRGTNNRLLDPQGTATRAEVAAILRRFLERTDPIQ